MAPDVIWRLTKSSPLSFPKLKTLSEGMGSGRLDKDSPFNVKADDSDVETTSAFLAAGLRLKNIT